MKYRQIVSVVNYAINTERRKQWNEKLLGASLHIKRPSSKGCICVLLGTFHALTGLTIL